MSISIDNCTVAPRISDNIGGDLQWANLVVAPAFTVIRSWYPQPDRLLESSATLKAATPKPIWAKTRKLSAVGEENTSRLISPIICTGRLMRAYHLPRDRLGKLPVIHSEPFNKHQALTMAGEQRFIVASSGSAPCCVTFGFPNPTADYQLICRQCRQAPPLRSKEGMPRLGNRADIVRRHPRVHLSATQGRHP